MAPKRQKVASKRVPLGKNKAANSLKKKYTKHKSESKDNHLELDYENYSESDIEADSFKSDKNMLKSDAHDKMWRSDSEGSNIELKRELKPVSGTKVAHIMNKLLSSKDPVNEPILSKIKEEKDEKSVDVKTELVDTKPIKLETNMKKPIRIVKRIIGEDSVKERMFKIMATQGVVQLLNAIEQHKSGLIQDLKAAKLTTKKEKAVDKNLSTFMSLLDKNQAKEKSADKLDSIKHEAKSSWNVLADNYYQDASLKGWDEKEPSAG